MSGSEYAPPSGSAIESARRGELLALINWVINMQLHPFLKSDIELHLKHMRVDVLLADMRSACDRMKRTIGTEEWNCAQKDWEKVNAKLSAIQDLPNTEVQGRLPRKEKQ